MNAHTSVACCIGASDGFQACLLENMIVRGSLMKVFRKHMDGADSGLRKTWGGSRFSWGEGTKSQH